MIKTNIQWTGFAHNFWSGCQKISEGCKYCYMHRLKDANREDPNKVVRASGGYFYKPLYEKKPQTIFTCSMSDFFIEEADGWRADAWEVIRDTPQHTWQILTKRPERIMQCLPSDWGDGYPNVWLGVSVENQKCFHRVETLAKVPAAVRFISAEPLLEEVDFLVKDEVGNRPIDSIGWVIIGGESGFTKGKYLFRPTEVTWMERAVKDLKSSTSAKVFVKQMGTYLANKGIGSGKEGWKTIKYHGGDFDKFPESLKVQEMPDFGTN